METKANSNKKLGIIIGAVVVACALVVAFLSINAGSSNKDVSEQLQLAQSYIDELNYEKAIACLEEIIRIDPKNVDAYLMLADVYVEMEDPASAIEVLTNACKQVQDERLNEALEDLSGTTESGEQDVVEDVLPSSPYDEYVIDGVFHHGYKECDLTDEESALIGQLLQLAQENRREEFYQLVGNSAPFIELAKKYGNIYELMDGSGYNAYVWCAYNDYKVYCNVNGRYAQIAIIPINDATGYCIVWSNDSTNGYLNEMWTVSECANGMFEGSFVKEEYTYINGNLNVGLTYRGKVVDGFYDETVICECNNYALNMLYYEATDYDKGYEVPAILQDNGDGTCTVSFGYNTDENGNPLIDEDGGPMLSISEYMPCTAEEYAARRTWFTGTSGPIEMVDRVQFYFW